jgi:hypothetical protein
VLQDLVFELLELASGLEAECLHKTCTPQAVRLERLGLAAAPVLREHQLCDGPLPKRVIASAALELRQQRGVPTEQEVGLDAHLENGFA